MNLGCVWGHGLWGFVVIVLNIRLESLSSLLRVIMVDGNRLKVVVRRDGRWNVVVMEVTGPGIFADMNHPFGHPLTWNDGLFYSIFTHS